MYRISTDIDKEEEGDDHYLVKERLNRFCMNKYWMRPKLGCRITQVRKNACNLLF